MNNKIVNSRIDPVAVHTRPLAQAQRAPIHPCVACSAQSSPGAPTHAAVVTGASTGIGRETALLLASKGWQVYAGVRTEAAERGLRALHENVRPVLLDVTDANQLKAVAELVREEVGSLQGLVNNAGKGVMCPVEHFPLESFRDVFEVNVFGVLASCQAFLPLLKAGETPGRIVNMSSVAGNLPLPTFGAYASSKHALEGLSDCMRYELAPQGVAVVLVKPGPVKTPIWQKSKAASQQVLEQLPPRAEAEYGELIKTMQRLSQESEEKGIAAVEVAEAVYEALTSAQPRTRYICGGDAPFTLLMKRLLPDRLWDPILFKSLDL